MINHEDNFRIRIVYLVLFRLWYTIPGTDDGSGEGKEKWRRRRDIEREGAGRWSRKVAAWSKLIEVYISIALSLYIWVSEFTVLSKVVLTAERKGKVVHRREMSPLTPYCGGGGVQEKIGDRKIALQQRWHILNNSQTEQWNDEGVLSSFKSRTIPQCHVHFSVESQK